MYWYQYHRIFRYVRRWDPWLISLNLGMLLFIAVVPFPTASMARYGDQPVAVVIYGAVLGTTGTLTWLMWLFAIRRRLVTSSLDRRTGGRLLLRASVTPLYSRPSRLTFWSRTCPRATTLPSSALVMITCQSCCVEP